jgi:hypothetical protein
MRGLPDHQKHWAYRTGRGLGLGIVLGLAATIFKLTWWIWQQPW